MSNYSKIKTFDCSNGKGIRTSIFFSGCEFYCKGCFNSEVWNFNVGELFTREVYETKIKPTITKHIAGISILGGEPFHPNNVETVSELVDWFAYDFPEKSVWIWTGYTWEELMKRCKDDDLAWTIATIDVLVDGQFVEEQKDLTLRWRGSCNQRVIDVQKSLEQGKVVLYKD